MDGGSASSHTGVLLIDMSDDEQNGMERGVIWKAPGRQTTNLRTTSVHPTKDVGLLGLARQREHTPRGQREQNYYGQREHNPYGQREHTLNGSSEHTSPGGTREQTLNGSREYSAHGLGGNSVQSPTIFNGNRGQGETGHPPQRLVAERLIDSDSGHPLPLGDIGHHLTHSDTGHHHLGSDTGPHIHRGGSSHLFQRSGTVHHLHEGTGPLVTHDETGRHLRNGENGHQLPLTGKSHLPESDTGHRFLRGNNGHHLPHSQGDSGHLFSLPHSNTGHPLPGSETGHHLPQLPPAQPSSQILRMAPRQPPPQPPPLLSIGNPPHLNGLLRSPGAVARVLPSISSTGDPQGFLHTPPSTSKHFVPSIAVKLLPPQAPVIENFSLGAPPITLQAPQNSDSSSSGGEEMSSSSVSHNAFRCMKYREQSRKRRDQHERDYKHLSIRNTRLRNIYNKKQYKLTRLKEFYIKSIRTRAYKCLKRQQTTAQENIKPGQPLVKISEDGLKLLKDEVKSEPPP